MNWISTKSEIPNTSEDVFALINEKEPIVAYYGVGYADKYAKERGLMGKMKINELQIGTFKDSQNGVVYLNFEGNESDLWEVNIDDICPIPITEELLANNGFEKHTSYWNKSQNYFKLPDKRFVLLSVMDSDEILYRIRGMGINVKYVHELQNALRMAGIEWEVNI